MYKILKIIKTLKKKWYDVWINTTMNFLHCSESEGLLEDVL